MEKSSTPNRQLSMCDMISDDLSGMNNQDVPKSCVTHDICADKPKLANNFCTFLQWQKHNEELLSRSVQGHHQSNVVEYNVQRAINTLSGSADKSMSDSTNKIAGMTRNIDRWKAHMFQVIENMRNEIDLLILSKTKIQKAQTALRIICSISTECLERRSFRLETDLTLDPGQVELVKEKELITEIGNLFCRTLSQIKDQLNRNKNVKVRLEKNWSDKYQSFQIDTINLGLNIQTPIIMSHADVIKDSENTCLSVPEWESITKSLYEEAEQVLNESRQLRSIVDDVLKKSANRLRDQADTVDIALARFISDTQQIGQAIENDLKQVVQRLGDSENLIGDLIRVIMNLEKAKQTAETRLHNRLKRPGDENVKDNAQLSLISEVKNLSDQLNTLNYQLYCARTGHGGLQEARSLLEDDSRIKRKTLWIDSIRCQRIRAHYPSVNILLGR
ncbi:tektin-4 [Acyrthosiphon pisum]|uniref:Tektin n=2 Tax=Acyrthosiphon pisum TaxID=7029 RepID=A0A8R2FBP3_ACYPI|nr:tektin-4 [Acyrthosiphon pisum]XP_016663422.1 tektin-4 [Acyrthosiphon pisum]XP_029342366.1 tektin-4 [Acyrthosiphon pisum]|eukprot:XP_003247476.1 PREDICTED: tektin-4 [Acyrthosiphon pisum]